MESNIHFKYKGIYKDSEIDLNDLGESLIGFDKLIHELISILNLR